MKRLICTAAIATAMVLSFSHPAGATTADDCQAQITSLSAATTATTFTDTKQGAKTQSQLLAHLTKASKALSLGENKSAAQEVSTYLNDLANALASGRVTADAAAPLQTAASSLADCIAGIQ
jgi:hypothetical protein